MTQAAQAPKEQGTGMRNEKATLRLHFSWSPRLIGPVHRLPFGEKVLRVVSQPSAVIEVSSLDPSLSPHAYTVDAS